MLSREKVEFQSACLIHYRFAGEKDAVLTMLTEHYGLIRLWAKGALAQEGRIPFFKPLLISWISQGDTARLLKVEFDRAYPDLFQNDLTSDYLYSALYANELVFRFLPESVLEPHLYSNYLWLLDSLSQQVEIEPVLRVYERQLLISSGLINDLSVDIYSGQAVESSQSYQCILHSEYGVGVTRLEVSNNCRLLTSVSGQALIAFRDHAFSQIDLMQEIKRLMRVLLCVLSEGKPIVSRSLFTSYRLK
jgi:DNA repair protein RecO (recombination protein O)